MPTFRFETVQLGKTKIVEEELSGAAQSGSSIKVYDEAGYLVATVNFSDVVRDIPGLRSSSSKAPGEEPGVMRSG
ncbi:MAG: hypothetical protein E5W59_12990 [Mesorhizobium sp.]|nr:MAG: hypothetical protein E5W59_12990 [Mesorhizobium sp.]